IGNVTSQIVSPHTEKPLGGGRETPKKASTVHHEDGSIDGGEQIVQIIEKNTQFVVAILKLFIDSCEFFDRGLKLFLRRCQLFVRALKLLVSATNFLVGGLQLL